MARACKILGSALTVLGLVIVVLCVLAMLRDEKYRQAELAATRNPGNPMYELEFGAARVRRSFEFGGMVAGVLATLNGVTMAGLGVVAGRTK
jgi:hypothetical protein